MSDDLPAVITGDDRLLEKVIDLGKIEVLERFIALRKSEEERHARISFEEHFAVMRAEMPSVPKTKENAGARSKYAPLELMQSVCDPCIYRHGFSYSWREEAIPNGKRVWLDIMGYGHVRSNFFDVPQVDAVKSRDGNLVQNLIQVQGVMSSYGQRYTFKAGFGIITEGEDADGQIPDDMEVLKLDLENFILAKTSIGIPKLDANAVDIIKRELAKPNPEVRRLQQFYKRARQICEATK